MDRLYWGKARAYTNTKRHQCIYLFSSIYISITSFGGVYVASMNANDMLLFVCTHATQSKRQVCYSHSFNFITLHLEFGLKKSWPPHANGVYSQTYSRKCVLLLFLQWLWQFFGNITAYCLKLPLIIINEFKYTIYTFAWYTTFVHKLRCVSKRKQSKLVSLQYNPMKWRGLLMSPMFGDPISM